jgi:hypothetical protein
MRLFFASVLILAVVGACARTPKSTPPAAAARSVAPEAARTLYPDLASLYGGDTGIYRTCAANQGVCHNDKEHPNLATLGAVVQTIGAPCNLTKTRPHDVHDLCERPGDKLAIGGEEIEIASFGVPEADDDEKEKEKGDEPEEKLIELRKLALGAAMEMRLRRAPRKARLGEHVVVKRPTAGGESLDLQKFDVAAILREPGRFSIQTTTGMRGFGGDESNAVLASANPLAVHVGDPNEDGVYGADLGGALIVPGRPDRSYILVRLTDPSAGPLMPRANCCSWTKASLRALYCWVAGLRPDGKNALDKIDYDRCPPGPVEDVIYPEPGVACETSGMCPVQPHTQASDATWTAVYENVLAARCGGSACHTEEAASELDLRSKDVAFKSVTEHLVPNAPARSEIYVRVSPDLCKEPSCTPMPLRKPALDAPARDLLRRWIERGAPKD